MGRLCIVARGPAANDLSTCVGRQRSGGKALFGGGAHARRRLVARRQVAAADDRRGTLENRFVAPASRRFVETVSDPRYTVRGARRAALAGWEVDRVRIR